MSILDDLPPDCSCRSGLVYAECCTPRPPAPVEPEESEDAAAVYREAHALFVETGLPPSTAALYASAVMVWTYVENRRSDPRFRSYFGYRRYYEDLIRTFGRGILDDDDIPGWLLLRAPFDLRAYPDRRAPAALFLRSSSAGIPPEAARAVRAQLRARDDFARVERDDGAVRLHRLRDNRCLPSASPIEAGARFYLGRLVDFGGQFHGLLGGPSVEETGTRWKLVAESAEAHYHRKDRHLPKHTHPGKVGLIVQIFLRQREESRRISESTPPLDLRAYRRWYEQMLADPEYRREERADLRWMSRSWCDWRLTELGGITPRQAAATPQGRQRVEQILSELEDNPFLNRPEIDVSIVRRRLGLEGGRRRTSAAARKNVQNRSRSSRESAASPSRLDP